MIVKDQTPMVLIRRLTNTAREEKIARIPDRSSDLVESMALLIYERGASLYRPLGPQGGEA